MNGQGRRRGTHLAVEIAPPWVAGIVRQRHLLGSSFCEAMRRPKELSLITKPHGRGPDRPRRELNDGSGDPPVA